MRTVVLAALLAGCGGVQPAPTPPEMQADYDECLDWALGMPNYMKADGTPKSTGDWLVSCLRGRGWDI